MQKIFFIALLLSLQLQNLMAQDLEALLEQETPEEKEYTIATFKSSRIVDGQSIENIAKNELDLTISHHFGTLNSGFFGFYGLDESNIRIDLEYGLSDAISVHIARSSFDKLYDTGFKIKIIRQQKGKINIPFSLSFYGETAINGLDYSYSNYSVEFAHRVNYVGQILLASKLNSKISVQISPTILHQNLVETPLIPNTKYAIGIGGRFKLGNRFSINPEYYYALNYSDFAENHLAIGFDIETGGHVFQLFLGNSRGISSTQFIGDTQGKWSNGDIRMGFNIHRFFSINQKKAEY